MDQRIAKLREEFDKNSERISALQMKNKKLSEQITKLENTDIIGLIRESGIGFEELSRLLKRNGFGQKPQTNETEASKNEN